MNDHPLKRTLNQLAEAGVPADLDLRAAIHHRLETSKAQTDKGFFPMKASFAQPRRLAALIMALVLLLLTAFLLTPQGQTWAQELFQFFTPAESDSFQIPTEHVFPVPDTPTPVPTYILELETVEATEKPATLLEQPGTSCSTYEDLKSYFCQIWEVETQAGFDAKELPFDPKGMKFSDASFNYERQVVTMVFEAHGGGGRLYLHQGMEDGLLLGAWDEVPAEGVKQVTVNGQYAELASGSFVAYSDANEAIWEPEAGLLRLRWREGNRWFSLEKEGDVVPIEWIDEQALIELAESLVDERDIHAQIPVDPEYLESIEAAEELAGFDIPAPTFLPTGYEFKRAAWVYGTVRLMYGPETSSDEPLHIFMGPIEDFQVGPCAEELCPPEQESVQVGLWQGWYWRGIFNASATSIPGEPTPTPVWEADARSWQLIWNTDSLWINMWFVAPYDYGGDMDKATMIAIAESMR